MTFPIKKRINTELFIDAKQGLGRVELKLREWKQGSLFGTTYITRKERQTNDSLFEKTLKLQKWKISKNEKRGFERKLRLNNALFEKKLFCD